MSNVNPREQLETARALLRGTPDRRELVVGVESSPLVALELGDRTLDRLEELLADAVETQVSAVETGKRDVVAYGATGSPDAISYVDAETLPAALEPLADPAPIDSGTVDGAPWLVGFRIVDDDRTVVGIHHVKSGDIRLETGRFGLVGGPGGYELLDGPVLSVPDRIDMLYVDGGIFLFNRDNAEALFDRLRDGDVGYTDDEDDEDTPTVLVVEDEEDLAQLYATHLEGLYEVVVVTDGETALENAPDADAMLLDRRIPGLSGDEVLDRLRERGLDCAVAMVTAVEPDFDIVDLGIDDYVTKPIDRSELRRTVEGLLAVDDYDDLRRELSSMEIRRNVLEVEKSKRELTQSEEYDALEEHIDSLRARLDSVPEGSRSDS